MRKANFAYTETLGGLKKNQVNIDEVYYCPHRPTKAKNRKYKKNCKCHRPGTGMMEKARDKFKLSLNDSWVIGGRHTDIIAGRLMNIKTVLVEICGFSSKYKSTMGPQFRAKNLKEAVELILSK